MIFKDRTWKRKELERMSKKTRDSISKAEATIFEAGNSHSIQINTDMDWGYIFNLPLRHNIVLSFTPSLPENIAQELGEVLRKNAEEYLDGLDKKD